MTCNFINFEGLKHGTIAISIPVLGMACLGGDRENWDRTGDANNPDISRQILRELDKYGGGKE